MSERRTQATIPEPYTDVKSLRATAMATKELVETLAGQRGAPEDFAVTSDDMAKAIGAGLGTRVAKSGDTINGDLVVNGDFSVIQAAGTIAQATGSSVMIQQASGSSQCFLAFHIPGVFACNFGMNSAGDFYMGGWSFGAVAYKQWSSRDFANPACDYRIKDDVTPLPSMWERVKALKPVSYRTREFSLKEGQTEPNVHADDSERWGMIAHEVQEALIDTAANGVKDDPDIIQAPTALPIITALVKALQEAMARIEALEAGR